MLGTMTLMLLAGAVVAAWFDALSARELAGAHCHNLCRQAGLQLLDQSVALQQWRVARIQGRLGVHRRYGFEVSFDGTDRHPGTISFAGRMRTTYTLPLRETHLRPAIDGNDALT